MKPPQSHKPFLILATAVTLLVAALYLYMYWQVNVSVGKAVVARDLAHNEEAFKERQNDMKRLHESTAAERALLKSFFIPKDETVEFIEAVESIGPQSGAELVLSSIDADPLTGAVPGTYGLMKAHVEAQGSWVAVSKALMLAERLPYKVLVDNVRLDMSAASSAAKGTRVWRVSFDIYGTLIVNATSTPQ
jgi:hypothetical protein